MNGALAAKNASSNTVLDRLVEWAEYYNVEPAYFAVTAYCESNFKHEGIYGDKGKAYGIFQFHRTTFEAFKKEAGLTKANYYSEEDQIRLAAWAFSKNKDFHWTCARYAKRS